MSSLHNNFHTDNDEQSADDVAEFAQRLQEAADNPTCPVARQALSSMISSLFMKYDADFTKRLFKMEHYGDLFCRYIQSVPHGEQVIEEHIVNLWKDAGIESFKDFENQRIASNDLRRKGDQLGWTQCVGLGDLGIQNLVNKAMERIKKRGKF